MSETKSNFSKPTTEQPKKEPRISHSSSRTFGLQNQRSKEPKESKVPRKSAGSSMSAHTRNIQVERTLSKQTSK